MKRFPPLIPLLLALLGTACGGSASYTPADFTTEVYTPAYASGFDIRGTERNAATLVTVRTRGRAEAASNSICSFCAKVSNLPPVSTARS